MDDKAIVLDYVSVTTGRREDLRFSGVWIGDLPEAERLKRQNRFRTELTELRERWDNRLVLERCSLWEEYRRGRLSVACYLERRAGHDHSEFASGMHGGAAIGQPISVLIFRVDPRNGLDRDDGDEELVFVEVVELGDLPESKIPSLVRLYHIENMRGELGRGFLYRSEIMRGYKVLPFFAYRERDPVVVFPDEVRGNIVERGAQIVHDVANQERNFGWRRGERVELQEIAAGLRVLLNMNFAEVRLKKPLQDRFDSLDVVVGPLDL
ncbi:MAG: hypothetical protein WD688_01730 [Candidatus Binatia bacterium]